MSSRFLVGKKGIGLGKRARSPSASERLAKMAKMAEDAKHGDYRSRARDEYNNRRAEGRLGTVICLLVVPNSPLQQPLTSFSTDRLANGGSFALPLCFPSTL